MPRIEVTCNQTNYTLSNQGPPPGAWVQVAGPKLLGLSKALAQQANNRGEFFGLTIVGSQSDGVDVIADAIRRQQITVYEPS